MQGGLQEANLEGLALHASCQRLRHAGLTSQQYLCTPELLRIIKLVSGGRCEAAVAEVLQISVSLWQAVVPQLLSLLLSSKVASRIPSFETVFSVSCLVGSGHGAHRKACCPSIKGWTFALCCLLYSQVDSDV